MANKEDEVREITGGRAVGEAMGMKMVGNDDASVGAEAGADGRVALGLFPTLRRRFSATLADGNTFLAKVAMIAGRLSSAANHFFAAVGRGDRHDIALNDARYGRCHFHRTAGVEYDDEVRLRLRGESQNKKEKKQLEPMLNKNSYSIKGDG